MAYSSRSFAKRATSSAQGGSFYFPKHREILTEDFYDDKTYDSNESNPYASRTVQNDWEDYSTPTHRATNSGVLSSYKKQLNLTPDDLMMKDYWDSKRDFTSEMAKNFP